MYLFQYHFLQKVLTEELFLADAYTPASFLKEHKRNGKKNGLVCAFFSPGVMKLNLRTL